jgi:L-iditol 2-dehydrogenase
MKALCLMAPRSLEVTELPDVGEPGRGEVLVRITAVGICGSDLHYFRGENAGYDAIERGFVMGHECAGVVEAAGPGVALREGDRVALDPAISCGRCETCLDGHPHVCAEGRFVGSPGVPGALRERLVHPARLAHPLPPAVTDSAGALLEPLGVALHAIDLARVRVADTVAVLGAGPIGLLLVRLARLSGAQAVFATDRLDHRLRLAKASGATETINASHRDPVAVVRDATDGRGVDVAFEAAGAPDTPEQAVQMARPLGTVVVVGICAENRTAFTATASRRKGLTVKISRRMKHVYPRTLALVTRGMVDVESVISHRAALADAAAAFAIAADYRDEASKIVVAP